MHALVLKQLQNLEKKHQELEERFAQMSLSKQKIPPKLVAEYSRNQKFIDQFSQWKKLQQQLEETQELLNDATMADLAKEEHPKILHAMETIEQNLNEILLPEEPQNEHACFLEIRAGTGGEEAAIFCADLFKMYVQYALSQNYSVETHHRSESETGGLKAVTLKISGRGAYGTFKHESGGHRVQRVPETESQGRIHTSNCIVMVIAQAPERKAIEINPSELRVDTYRASGAGGQHVNKTDSAVRITHLPTGIVAACQTGRSQHQNRAAAMEMLLARLEAFEAEKHNQQETELRLSLLSSGRRTDRIRTYNFPQDRLTDHRLPITLFGLEEILSGNLDRLLQPIFEEYRLQRIAQLEANLSQQVP